MLLAQINQAGTEFRHVGDDSQEVTLCLTEAVGISGESDEPLLNSDNVECY